VRLGLIELTWRYFSVEHKSVIQSLLLNLNLELGFWRPNSNLLHYSHFQLGHLLHPLHHKLLAL
jgi:hypothetical protein